VTLVTQFVVSLITVFIMLVLARIVWSYFPHRSTHGWIRATQDFVNETTGWYLAPFRRIIPPIGILDLSVMAAILVLFILRSVAANVLGSF
jgi:YggT family protein